MTELLLLTTMMFPIQSHGDEISCLANIMYQEGRSESLEGVIAIGEASKSRAKRTNKSICKIRGVTRKKPPERLKSYWNGIAKIILNDKQKPTIGLADSWNKGKRPGHDGAITKYLAPHVFYVMNGELK